MTEDERKAFAQMTQDRRQAFIEERRRQRDALRIDEDNPIYQAIDSGGGQCCDIPGILIELEKRGFTIVPEADRTRAAMQIEELRGILTKIDAICRRPSSQHPKGSHAYTHFMSDFDEIRKLIGPRLGDQGQESSNVGKLHQSPAARERIGSSITPE